MEINKQWCAGLLNDGIAATVGPTNEPFLATFPQPDDFFPVLFTGKLTLGETYWKTTNGIRLTGMPAFKNSLNDNQLWQVSVMLANADKLPPSAANLLSNAQPALQPNPRGH